MATGVNLIKGLLATHFSIVSLTDVEYLFEFIQFIVVNDKNERIIYLDWP